MSCVDLTCRRLDFKASARSSLLGKKKKKGSMKQNSQQQNKTRMYRNITQWRNDLVFGSIMPPSRFSAVIAKKKQK